MSNSMDSEYIDRSQVDELVNPKGACWVCHQEGLHQECSDAYTREREQREKELQGKLKLFEEKKLRMYSISGTFGFMNSESEESYKKAKSLVESILEGEHSYDESKVFEGEGFWFVPYFFIGLTGYIVCKKSTKIYALGSGLGDMWDGIEMYLNDKLVPEIANKK